MHHDDVLFGRVKSGVLTVSGHFPRFSVEADDLNIADGHGDTAVSLKLRRADRLVSRIIVTRSEGYISFAAVKWLRDVGIGLAQLDFNGDVIMATAQRSLDLASMRRAQCLTAGSDFGRSIVRELLQAKLDGQAAVARIMGRAETAAAIDDISGRLKTARTEPEMLATEGMAAQAYWSAWASLPVTFARQHRVSSRWKTFGPRRSSLTDKPQRAVSPANAVLNYLYGVLASQVTIALIGQGLEPGISIGLHADKQARASFT